MWAETGRAGKEGVPEVGTASLVWGTALRRCWSSKCDLGPGHGGPSMPSPGSGLCPGGYSGAMEEQ